MTVKIAQLKHTNCGILICLAVLAHLVVLVLLTGNFCRRPSLSSCTSDSGNFRRHPHACLAVQAVVRDHPVVVAVAHLAVLVVARVRQ